MQSSRMKSGLIFLFLLLPLILSAADSFFFAPVVSFGFGRTNLKEDFRTATIGNLSININKFIISGQLTRHYKIDITGDRPDFRQIVTTILAGRILALDKNARFYISAETGYSWIKEYDYLPAGEPYTYDIKIIRKNKIPLKVSFVNAFSKEFGLRLDSIWGFSENKTYYAVALSLCMGYFNFLYEE